MASPETKLHSHLSDTSLTPLLTTARSPQTLANLTALTSTALTAHLTMLRLNMGPPRRILAEYPDGLVLNSFLAPPPRLKGTTGSEVGGIESATNGEREDTEGQGESESNKEEELGPPLLVAVVAAQAGDGREAQRAAARLEKVGREFQKEWTAEEEGGEERTGE